MASIKYIYFGPYSILALLFSYIFGLGVNLTARIASISDIVVFVATTASGWIKVVGSLRASNFRIHKWIRHPTTKGKNTIICLQLSGILFQHGIFSALTFCIGFHAFDVVQLYCHGKCEQQKKNAEIRPVYQHMHAVVVVAAAAHKPNQVLETKLWKLSKFNERSSA